MTDKRAEQDPASDGDTPLSPREENGSGHASGVGGSIASADMQALIGRQLRAVYDDIAKQPVPDRFLELMSQLDAKPSTGSDR